MKLSTIFKKEKSTTIKAQAQKLDKKQLEKVIGGTDTISSTEPSGGCDRKNGALASADYDHQLS